MDRWKPKEVKQMELGGNKSAQVYFEKQGMYGTDGKPNYKAPQLAKYKQDLLKKVEIALGSQLQHQGSAVFQASQHKEQTSLQQESVNGQVKLQFGSDNLFEANNALNSLTLKESSPSFAKDISRAAVEEQKKPAIQVSFNKQSNSSSLVASQQSGGFSGFGGITLGAKQQDVKTLNAKKLDVNFDNDDFFNSFEPTTAANNNNGAHSINKTVSMGAPAHEKLVSNNNGSNGVNQSGKFVTKLQEVEDQFDLFPKSSTNTFSMQPNQASDSSFSFNKQISFGGSSQPQNQLTEQEARQKLQQMGNKKGISSEDFFGRQEEKSEEVKQKYNQLAGQKAISSDMFFGSNGGQNGRTSGGKDLGDEVEGYLMGRSSQTSKRYRLSYSLLGSNSYDEYKEQAARIAEKVSENAKILKNKALDWLSTFSQQ